MSDFKKVIQKLNEGILPDELNFTIAQPDVIDWEKVRYNTFYKDPGFYLGKFPNPKAFLNLPGSEDIINNFIENAKTPLEEIEERQKLSHDILEIENAMAGQFQTTDHKSES